MGPVSHRPWTLPNMAGELTYRNIRERVEAEVGLPHNALKPRRAEINAIVDRLNSE